MKIPKNKVLSIQHNAKNITVFFTKNLEPLCYIVLKVRCKGFHFLYGDNITLIEPEETCHSDKEEALFWHSK